MSLLHAQFERQRNLEKVTLEKARKPTCSFHQWMGET